MTKKITDDLSMVKVSGGEFSGVTGRVAGKPKTDTRRVFGGRREDKNDPRPVKSIALRLFGHKQS